MGIKIVMRIGVRIVNRGYTIKKGYIMQSNTLDLSQLPLPLRQELIDFYQFLIEKHVKSQTYTIDNSQQLMQLAGKISAFKMINDPVAWQQQQRNEWDREWNEQ